MMKQIWANSQPSWLLGRPREGQLVLGHFLSLLLLAFAVSLDSFGAGITYGLRKIAIPLLSVCIIALCSGIVILLSMQFGTWITGYLSPLVAQLVGAIVLIAIGGWAIIQFVRSRPSRKVTQADAKGGTGRLSGGEKILAHGQGQNQDGDQGQGQDRNQDQYQDHEQDRDQDEDQDSQEKPLVRLERLTEFDAQNNRMAVARTVLIVDFKRIGLVIQILRTPQAADVDRSGSISPSEAIWLGTALSLDSFGAGLGAALLGFTPWLTASSIAVASALFLLFGLRAGRKLAGKPIMRHLGILPGVILIAMGIARLL